MLHKVDKWLLVLNFAYIYSKFALCILLDTFSPKDEIKKMGQEAMKSFGLNGEFVIIQLKI